MSESVAQIVGRLRFMSSSAPAVYLNEALVHETFVSHLGAIDRFARNASQRGQGEVGVPVVKIGASREGSTSVEYDVRDAYAQALILHSAVATEGAVEPPRAGLPPGSFVELIAPVRIEGVDVFPDVAALGDIETLRVVIGERDNQQSIIRAFGNDETVLMPLLAAGATGVVASIIDRSHIRPGLAASYLNEQQVVFGLMERTVDAIPFFTMLYMRPYI